MQIQHAVNISSLINNPEKINEKVRYLSLSALEEEFVKNGWDEGSFGIFKVTYSDNLYEIYLDYPTDITEVEALDYATSVLEKLHNKE